MGSRLLTDPVMSFLKIKIFKFSQSLLFKRNLEKFENLIKTKERKKPYRLDLFHRSGNISL
jgi:hypothetical protein